MAYPNGQTVSDVKKNVSSAASKIGSDLKSEFNSEAKDVKSDAKEIKSDMKAKAEKVGDRSVSIGESVLSSALSLLPVKNSDEIYSMLETTLKDVQGGISTARDSATAFVKKYPLYSLLGAAVLGASAVMIIGRRKSSVKYDA